MATTKKPRKTGMQRWEDLVRKVFGGPTVGPYPPGIGPYDKLPPKQPQDQ